MYPHHPNHNNSSGSGNQLTRYGSAPSSVFESSDVVVGAGIHSSQAAGFAGPMSSTSLTIGISGGVGSSSNSMHPQPHSSGGGLIRHSSSPPGFLQHLAPNSNAGFAFTKGSDNYNNNPVQSSSGHRPSRLSSHQLSFTNQLQGGDHQSSLKRASSSSTSHSNRSSSNGFSIGPWEDGQSLVFGGASSSSKRPKNVSDELLNSLSAMDHHSQMELSEMGMMHIPEDSVACKVRAKRGCATHPRSIAERERRTRISGKLKKLQELVPNMDKQTSYSEMLDLAIQHITGLQIQIQKLNKDLNNCTCGCKPKS